VATLALAFAGCGDDGKSEDDHATTPGQAIAEIAKVRSGLDTAMTSYGDGDAKRADAQVGDAYLEHFEHVEGPLEEVDAELNERLEDTIREELRDRIKAGAPAAEVKALVGRINADLDKAEAALRP
jgi:hypothetical protein